MTAKMGGGLFSLKSQSKPVDKDKKIKVEDQDSLISSKHNKASFVT